MKGSSEITIYDVAKALGLSPSTISRGLSDHPHLKKETILKIKETAREMRYRQNKFARNLRQKKTNTIGVVVPKLNSNFLSTAIAGIENVIKKAGYGLIISQSQESGVQEASCVSTLFHSRVDGLLVSIAYDTNNFDHFQMLHDRKIPVVFFDRVIDCPDCMSVVIDNFKAGYEVTSHLISEGCRKIVHVTANLSRNVYSERLRGYRKALEENNISYDPGLIFINDLTEKAGIEVARSVIAMKKRPDAIFAANDATAVAAMTELQEHGIRVPADIAVAGFNNEQSSRIVNPKLTTIDHPAMLVGETAARYLLEKLRNPGLDTVRTIVVKHDLIIRQSSLKHSLNSTK